MEKHSSEHVKNLQFQHWLQFRINMHTPIGRIRENLDTFRTMFSDNSRQFWTANAYNDGMITVESV